MTIRASGYRLIDPRPLALKAPYTFFLPAEEQIAALRPDDLVKLLFEHVPAGLEWGEERMWVTIERVTADGFTGRLDNKPFEPTATLRVGDEITFRDYHILDTIWDEPRKSPPKPERREYWERCLVDASVLDGSSPVEFIYRETPELALVGDKFPDSGWRIRGKAGGSHIISDKVGKPQYVALGAVLNRDDSWLAFIEAPVGTRLVRDFATDSYVEEA